MARQCQSAAPGPLNCKVDWAFSPLTVLVSPPPLSRQEVYVYIRLIRGSTLALAVSFRQYSLTILFLDIGFLTLGRGQ